MSKTFLGVSMVVVAVLAITGFFFPKSQPVFDLGAFSGPDVYDAVRFQDKVSTGEFTQGGGTLTISTTSATYTLTQAELADANVIKIASVPLAAATTITLPATSTLTTLLPKDGDTRDWVIWNAHTSAATTSTIAAGTGIDLQGDGTGDDVINGGVFGKLKCTRLDTRDVVCYINEGVAAD